MTVTTAWILAAMLALRAGDHSVLAEAIAKVVADEAPLFRDDEDKRRTASLLVAIAYRESGFVNDIAAKNGEGSVCAFQIMGGAPSLRKDALACTRAAFALLRWSVRSCPAAPVAGYAVGLAGCASPVGQRISRDRMNLAAWLYRTVTP